jgi:sugar lactone lactonase YvrE
MRGCRFWILALAAAALGAGAPPSRCGSGGAGRLVLVAGGGTGGDGSKALEAKLVEPFGIEFDRARNMYVVELGGNAVRRVSARGVLTTCAGTGERADGGDGGPATRARLNGPHGLVLGPKGELYIADTWNSRVRKLDLRSGVITTVAGTGVKGYGGDGGPATAAQFGGIYGVALDHRARNLYLADLDNRRVRVVNLATGIVTTVAGNGERGVPEDGADARTSPLWDPRAVAVDSRGNLYILERSGHALRVVDTRGKIRTVVGTGKAGFSRDGGPARQVMLNGPKHLCVDANDHVILADTENHVILKYLPREGQVIRVAGTGQKGTAGLGGPPEQAELNQPHGVFVDRSGVLYIADSSNHRVLRIER